MSARTETYLMAVDWVLRNTDATVRSWKAAGRRMKLPHGVPYRFIEQPVIGPQVVTVTLQIRDEDWKVVAALGERLAMTASSAYARVYRDLALVRIEFTLPQGEWQDVLLRELPHRPNAATIGRKALGPSARVGWEPPHKALFGATRSGKTTCLTDFVISLARHSSQYEFIIVNPKNDPALHPFRRLPQLAAPIADNYDDGLMLLRLALAEMERRRGDSRLQAGAPRLVVLVDEVAQLVERHPEAGAIITQLSQMAGGLDINLVVASQAANPTVFGDKGSLAKANFTSRLVFQLPHDQAYLACGLPGEHPEKLGGKGDGLAIVNGRVTRIRAALPQAEDYDDLPRAEVEPEWPDRERLAGEAALAEKWQVPPEMVHYALFEKSSARQIQKQFGGAMSRAQLARDYARAFKRIHNAWRRGREK